MHPPSQDALGQRACVPRDRPTQRVVEVLPNAIGIDVGDEDYADSIQDKCRRNGLLVSAEGSTVLLLPSLVIDKRTAARGLDLHRRGVRRVLNRDGECRVLDISSFG